MVELLLKTPLEIIDEHLKIYSFVPPEADQGWKLALFDLRKPLPYNSHNIAKQLIVVVEGELKVVYGNEESVVLKRGQLISIDPGVVHALIPHGHARFFSIDWPASSFPEDMQSLSKREDLPFFQERYFGPRLELAGYGVYELVRGEATGGQWSIALLDIMHSPKHFHRIETEQFIVVNGVLNIEVDEKSCILNPGDHIQITPGNIHMLKSATYKPVQTLCFSFPAFDLDDMHLV